MKRLFLVLLLACCISAAALLGFYAIGAGWLGGPWQSSAVTAGPRESIAMTPVPIERRAAPQILFGDLHAHTNYSFDAYLFNTRWMKGTGVVTPADACDFARYCSALDFWSINDHAEGLTPRVWADTVAAIRDCNANAGDPAHPDMVSFLGWEWSSTNRDDIPSHYGHKNVIFRSWDQGMTPSRPIAAAATTVFNSVPAALAGLLSVSEGVRAASDFGWYLQESSTLALCPEGVPANELPINCREVALTPSTLYQKLDEWGFDSIVIPHGLAWGTTNPMTADFRMQLDEHQQRYEKLLEVYSGHGNSELFLDFERVGKAADGSLVCPQATDDFLPCCRQAGELTRRQCEEPSSKACEAQVKDAMLQYMTLADQHGRALYPEASVDDWNGCGQLQHAFQPASLYVPRQTAQYNLALGFDEYGSPKRAPFGLIGSSDGHQARPGSSYKESNRLLYTDSKETGKEILDVASFNPDKESGGFYYTGGLVAVHADGRDRDAIWRALNNRNVYATSGGRMQVWFDLLNGPSGPVPMGTEVLMTQTPRFRVQAQGEFEQLPGCPDYAVAALGKARVESLCGGECFHPGGARRKTLERIEIVRIRPQVRPDEVVAPLIENLWRVFPCPADGAVCSAEFDDPEYASGGRSTLYYARVIQQAEPLINGDPFGCEYDAQGQCVKRNYCIGPAATADNNCLTPAEPRAWTSPIFVEYR